MEEKNEEQEMRDLFAGIALPGVIGRAGMLTSPGSIAIEAYNIAEAMMFERARRVGLTPNPNENASIH